MSRLPVWTGEVAEGLGAVVVAVVTSIDVELGVRRGGRFE